MVVLMISGYDAFVGGNKENLRLAFLGGLSGFAATAVGAVVAIALRDIASRTQDIMLGFAAGMMLAASSFSLILPGIEAARELSGNSWLFVLAITLHNLPEGMAIGVSFATGDLQVGIPLTTAIAIQDIPEGLAVAVALRVTGISALRAALIAVGSGLIEPFGALVGLGISSAFALGYPIAMGLAAGAMIFVVSHEVIPETHRNGHETLATLGLMLGFGVMTFLDTALG
jgi:ZIP family zinc transporter